MKCKLSADTGQIHIAKSVKIILFVDHVSWITRPYYDGELIYCVVYKAPVLFKTPITWMFYLVPDGIILKMIILNTSKSVQIMLKASLFQFKQIRIGSYVFFYLHGQIKSKDVHSLF